MAASLYLFTRCILDSKEMRTPDGSTHLKCRCVPQPFQLKTSNTMTSATSHPFAEKLLHRFRKQRSFCQQYSPLYAALFCSIGTWLQEKNDTGLWLIQAAQSRSSFDIPMLISAGLHYLVLEGKHAAALAEFFPTAGGDRQPDAQDLKPILQQTVRDNMAFLEQWITTVRVQTNESGRGLGWALPLLYTPWSSVGVVDLGASAGLNLIADKRSFLLTFDIPGFENFKLGTVAEEQFALTCRGSWSPPVRQNLPYIGLRMGCDRNPLALANAHDERLLRSFVWADQPLRMQRLDEGIQAFRKCCRTESDIPVHRVDLPEELAAFLDTIQATWPTEPLILFSSYIKNYLPDKGKVLFKIIREWATGQERAILWLQQDLPAADTVASKPPDLGWVLWSADLWQAAEHTSFHLAWCHPHGTQIEWLPGIGQWQRYWL